MRKLQCPCCGNVARQARAWMARGLLTCYCGEQMLPVEACDLAYIGRLTADDMPRPQWTAICRLNGWEDAIIRTSPGRLGGLGVRESILDRRIAPAAACVHAGCPLWVKTGADRCAAGHAQTEDAPALEEMAF
jgi:hypothetical protein